MPTFEPVACLIGQGAPSDVGVDQSNEAPWDGASTNIAPENGVEQSFRPFKFPLIAVAVEITRGSGHVGVDTITMNIIGEDEAILASSSIDVCFSFQGGDSIFMPQPGVTVDPGITLVIRLEDTGKGGFGWKYGVIPVPSAQGLHSDLPVWSLKPEGGQTRQSVK